MTGSSTQCALRTRIRKPFYNINLSWFSPSLPALTFLGTVPSYLHCLKKKKKKVIRLHLVPSFGPPPSDGLSQLHPGAAVPQLHAHVRLWNLHLQPTLHLHRKMLFFQDIPFLFLSMFLLLELAFTGMPYICTVYWNPHLHNISSILFSYSIFKLLTGFIVTKCMVQCTQGQIWLYLWVHWIIHLTIKLVFNLNMHMFLHFNMDNKIWTCLYYSSHTILHLSL